MTRSLTARRTLAAAALAPLLLTGFAACGDDEPSATDASSESAAPASDETTPEADESIDPASFVDDVLGSLEDASTAHLTMTMEGGPAAMTMEGDVDYTTAPPEMDMTMTNAMMGDGDISVRLVDGVMYMQMPDLGGGKWIKMPLDGAGSPLSGDLMDQMNPGAQLESMKDAVDEVEYVGEDEIGKHYTMKVRTEAFRDLQDQLGGAGVGDDLPSVLTYDLWTDDDGQLTQSTIAMGKLGSVTISMTGWGEPVDIEAPPAADIMEMPDMSGMMSEAPSA